MADIKVKVLDEDAPEVKVKSEAPQEEEVKVEEKTQDSVEAVSYTHLRAHET